MKKMGSTIGQKEMEENGFRLMVAGSLERVSVFDIIFSAESREKV